MSKITHENFPDKLEPYFKKAPNLSEKIRKFIVQYIPYYALIVGILGVIGAVSTLGILSVASPFAMNDSNNSSTFGMGTIATLLWLASSVLLIMAYPDLKDRKYKGWNFYFWSDIIHFVGSLVAGQLLSPLISVLIGLYILFQIKSFYK